MKKIIIQPICSAQNMIPHKYKITGKKYKVYDKEIYYGLNGLLVNELKSDDEIKIFTIGSSFSNKAIDVNAKIYEEEINRLFPENIKYTIKSISVPYDESDVVFEKMFSDIISQIEDNSEIYVDITFGDRLIPFFLFSVVQFAERYLNCKLKVIICMKQDYNEEGKVIEGSHRLNDITSVYYLNKMVNSMKVISGKDAVENVKKFLSL